MPLTSPRFAGNDRLERCAAGDFDARLTLNTVGDFVALVQQALMDLGESLPQFGADGGYGQETMAAVLDYKTRHDLRSPDGSIDGIVGPLTMTKLDEERTALDETAEPCPRTRMRRWWTSLGRTISSSTGCSPTRLPAASWASTPTAGCTS